MQSYVITDIYEIDLEITTITTFGCKVNTPIIISAAVYTELKGAYWELPWIEFGKRALKGKAEKINIHGLDEEGIRASKLNSTKPQS